MIQKYGSELKKGIMMIVCIGIAAVLAGRSNLNFPKVIVVAMVAYFLCFWKWKKTSAFLAIVTGAVLCVYSCRYFADTLWPIMEKKDATPYRQYTQLSIPAIWENHDMWVSPVVAGKTVDLTYAEEWCYAYFEEFAENVIIDRTQVQSISQESLSAQADDMFHLYEHYFEGTRDFFEKDVLSEMYDDENVGHLYLAVEGLIEADTLYVITDEDYNVYLLTTEILEKVLNADES